MFYANLFPSRHSNCSSTALLRDNQLQCDELLIEHEVSGNVLRRGRALPGNKGDGIVEGVRVEPEGDPGLQGDARARVVSAKALFLGKVLAEVAHAEGRLLGHYFFEEIDAVVREAGRGAAFEELLGCGGAGDEVYEIAGGEGEQRDRRQ